MEAEGCGSTLVPSQGRRLLAISTLGYVVYKTSFAPIKDGESDVVRAARLRRAQDKLYKRGAGRTRGRTLVMGKIGPRGPSRASKLSKTEGSFEFP